MLIPTNALVLSKLKYNDNDLIVKCYTQQLGIVSFLLRGILKNKKSPTKAAYFQPLSLVQLTIVYKENRSLQSVSDTKMNHHYASLHSHVLKSAIVMFLSEVLASTLKEEEPNKTLFSYLETTLLWLDEQTEFSNFHLLFMLNLSKYLGFYPDTGAMHLPYFNLSEGKFENNLHGDYTISGHNLTLLKQLLETPFDALSAVKINSKQRQSFLNMLLLYFELHLGSFKPPKSLQILNQVFN